MKSLLLLLGFSFSLLLIASCGNEPETCSDGVLNGTETGIDCGGECEPCPTVTTVSEDQENIKKGFDAALMCVRNLKNSRAVDVLFRDFLMLSEGEVFNDDWADDLGDELDDVIDGDHIDENNRLDIAHHAGTHIYDITSKNWSKVASPSDKMIFQFPSDPDQTTNNVELTIDQNEEKLITINGEDIFLPTAAHAMITVDNEKIFELTAKDIVYAENADFEIPVEATIDLFMSPTTLSISLTRQSNTDFTAQVALNDGDQCNVTVTVDAKLKDDDFENLSEDGFEKIDVTVAVGALSIQSLAGLADLIKIDDPSNTQINLFTNIEVLYNAIKIGTLEFDIDQEVVYIFYKDNSFEDSAIYYEEFLTELEEIVKEFTGVW